MVVMMQVHDNVDEDSNEDDEDSNHDGDVNYGS